MTTDPWEDVYLEAVEFCGSRLAATDYYGSPILVSVLEKTQRRTLVYPACVLHPGQPVVELMVRLDGVAVVSRQYRRHPAVLAESFHPFPVVLGVPCIAGVDGAEWRESVDVALTVALRCLPRASAALSSP